MGCGYAVHEADNDIYVVRLSDGTAWFLTDTADVNFTKPVGVTCDEVFVLGVYSGKYGLARLKLSSLGPGTPPD